MTSSVLPKDEYDAMVNANLDDPRRHAAALAADLERWYQALVTLQQGYVRDTCNFRP